ncbi:MAG TPA: hypothetical protein VHZ53_20525 [Steroidobacteraceae bacterium]|jgi:hypothetical protein|nr:hypothetical protein [Steroidobacteraceae bacterium]
MRRTLTSVRLGIVIVSLTAAVGGASSEAKAAQVPAAAAGTPHHCPSDTTPIEVGGGTLCTSFDAPANRRPLLREWVERSARIVTAYYGRFPAPSVVLEVHSSPGSGVHGGHTNNDPRLEIDVTVGGDTRAEDLVSDWVLVHEMIHLALPEVGRRHDWLAEGLATYVEGIARAQFGNRPAADVWAEYRRSMPHGQPQPDEGGMDQTHSWARTYWGGALFCLQADLAIREQTGNRMGLQTALRAILDATGGYSSERDIDEVFRIGDAATGTHALETLYREAAMAPMSWNLDELWTRLGVPADPLSLPFDDRAPLAAVREAITRPTP